MSTAKHLTGDTAWEERQEIEERLNALGSEGMFLFDG